MSNRDLSLNKRLRGLYRRFLVDAADQNFYRRYYARAQSEAEHHARKLSAAGNSAASADAVDEAK